MNTFVADLPELDIVDRLRDTNEESDVEIRHEAADELETLRDEAERLRVTIANLRIRLAQAKATGEQ